MKKALLIAGIAAATVLAAVSVAVLPASVGVQIGAGGRITGTMPKLWAVLIPALMAGAGAVIGLVSGADNSKKGTALMFIGIAVQVFTLFLNR